MRENKPERMALLMGSSWTQRPGFHACSEACADNLIPSGTEPRQKKTLLQKKNLGISRILESTACLRSMVVHQVRMRLGLWTLYHEPEVQRPFGY